MAKPSSVKGIGNMADNKRDSFSSPQLATAVAPLPEPVAEVSSESPCEAAKTASLALEDSTPPVWGLSSFGESNFPSFSMTVDTTLGMEPSSCGDGDGEWW